MDIQEQINHQRIKHIVSSYHLDGADSNLVNSYLEALWQTYPTPLIELALVETLVDHWLTLPLVRGLEFFVYVRSCLKEWESQPIISTITPEQFQQITGLDPTPVFGSSELPAPRSIVHPS